jgi:hypothetical protein
MGMQGAPNNKCCWNGQMGKWRMGERNGEATCRLAPASSICCRRPNCGFSPVSIGGLPPTLDFLGARLQFFNVANSQVAGLPARPGRHNGIDGTATLYRTSLQTTNRHCHSSSVLNTGTTARTTPSAVRILRFWMFPTAQPHRLILGLASVPLQRKPDPVPVLTPNSWIADLKLNAF